MIFILLICSFTVYAFQNESCECGSFKESIVHYQVGEGQDCCGGKLASDIALEGFYEQNEGQWELIEVTAISSATARERCCK